MDANARNLNLQNVDLCRVAKSSTCSRDANMTEIELRGFNSYDWLFLLFAPGLIRFSNKMSMPIFVPYFSILR